MKPINATVSAFSAIALALFFGGMSAGYAQSRINYNDQQLFLNGSNIAWVNFAGDLGPGPLNIAGFRTVFDSIHANGGNSLRLWLYTNGTQTPEFNSSGRVIGPGTNAISYLKTILDMAWQRKIGLMLCLWSFDMQRKSIGSLYTDRNALMLNDTSYTWSFINNALIPLVNGVKGHPAIISWEVFNEAEGMTDKFGWSDIYQVPIANIQRFVNLVAGAIHRTDPRAKVTTGAWALTVQTDVGPLAKQVDLQTRLNSMTAAEKQRIEREFTARYGIKMSAAEILARLAVPNYNYYRDDRLVAAGGDPDGTLDFYTDHYYDWQSTPLSPFHHPYSAWNLTKPLVIAEFFPEQTLAIPYYALYRILYDNGYAGAMSWGWYSGASGHDQGTLQGNTLVLIQDIFSQHPGDVTIVLKPGMIISFETDRTVIEKGQSSLLSWTTAPGSVVTLNGLPVKPNDSLVVNPNTTTTYKLVARGDVVDSSEVTVEVLLPGTIVFFVADRIDVALGESSLLSWHTVAGSSVTLNGVPVAQDDTIEVRPVADSTFTLIAVGEVTDTGSVTIRVVNPLTINRALKRPVVASSGEPNSNVADPALAVDGNRATRWSSAWSDNQWIYVDLGQRFNVDRVVLYWEVAYGRVYAIDVSDDAQNWTQIYFTSSSDGGIDDLTGLSGSGRYVRMHGMARATQWGFSLWEFEVYGVPSVTGIADEHPQQVPATFYLGQNYPNPFNPTTTIEYQIADDAFVTLNVYDILGREISTLVNDHQMAGRYRVTFDARRLATGMYFYKLQVTNAKARVFSDIKRMVLMK